MGGKAIKTIECSRFSKTDLEILSKQYLDPFGFIVIPSYANKEDFGDIDVLIPSSEALDIDKFIKENNLTHIFKNGNVTSVALHYQKTHVQLDLIVVPDESYSFAYSYFSYNDLGNLIGRIAHKFGMKFGHDGLKYVVRDKDHVIGEIVLTTDFVLALEFLGFQWCGRYGNFKKLEDIFEYVIDSKYFNPDIFLLENRSYKARVRDAKRKTYMGFLEYCRNQKFEDVYEFNPDKGVYLLWFLNYFDKVKEYYQILDKHQHNLDIKKKFNGEVVSKITGLQGKELGAFMSEFKKFHTDMTDSTPKEIEENVIDFMFIKYPDWKPNEKY
jgi:hypothetical protein